MLSAIGSLLIYNLPIERLGFPIFTALVSLQVIGIFGIRGVYFTLFEESKIERNQTGTATGFISFLGFTPEYFFTFNSYHLNESKPTTRRFSNFHSFYRNFIFFRAFD